MVEGPVDLAMVIDLKNAPSVFWCGLQTDLSTSPDVLSPLGCHACILLEYSLWSWSKLSNSLPYFLTFGNKFGIKYFTWCFLWCMHASYKKYGMICYAQKCLINHVLFPKYAQWSFEDKWQKGRHPSNSSSHLFLQIFSSSHTISIIFYSNKHFS